MDLDIRVPGAFIVDKHHCLSSSARPALTTTTMHPSKSSIPIFPTPQSLSAASSLARHRTSSNAGSRKRPRRDTAAGQNQPGSPVLGYFSHSNYDLLSSSTEPISPAPLANTNYRIAGGMDTPTARLEEDSEYDAQEDYRMSRFTGALAAEPQHFQDPHTPALLLREGNGRKRGYEESPRTAGWEIGRTVWALTGGVAVKVVNFAWSTGKAFTGFRAGGGAGYHFDGSGSGEKSGFADQSWTAVEGGEGDVFHSGYRASEVPGGFPEEGFIEDYMMDPGRRKVQELIGTPTLRGQGQTGSTMRGAENWVFVGERGEIVSREGSPTRKKVRSGSSLEYTSAPASRASIAGGGGGSRPRLAPSRPSASNASFASPRAGISNPNQTPDLTRRPRLPESRGHGHRRSRSSLASPRRETSTLALPSSPEILQFKKKIRKKERVVDQGMSRLNQQLQDMIREGKEALGTKFEVRDFSGGHRKDGRYELDLVDDEDEGYGEGD